MMIRHRRSTGEAKERRNGLPSDIHTWVLGLPWVVERPCGFGKPAVRTFMVDCAPLERSQLWFVSGLRSPLDLGDGLAVVVPNHAARAIEQAGLGQMIAPMPRGHQMIALR